jgi:hypothetical protein
MNIQDLQGRVYIDFQVWSHASRKSEASESDLEYLAWISTKAH